MSQPIVSIIVLTYNQKLYLKAVLDGVFRQQFSEAVELIIADDHSTDGTQDQLQALLEELPGNFQVRYYRHPSNKGAVKNFIWALQQAKGLFIAICDGDDYWSHPLKLTKQIAALEKFPNSVFCFHDGLIEDVSGTRNQTTCSSNLDTGVIDALEFISYGGGMFPTSSVMIRGHIIKDMPVCIYKDPGPITDLPLALIAVSKGDIIYLKEQMMVYRENAVNSWSAGLTKAKRAQVYLQLKDLIQAFNLETCNKFRAATRIFLHKELVKILAFRIVDAPVKDLPAIYREAVAEEGWKILPDLLKCTGYRLKRSLLRTK